MAGTPEDIAERARTQKRAELLATQFEKSVMLEEERKLLEDRKIKIIPETLEACILPSFKMKILPHAHTMKITDKMVEISAKYEVDYPGESQRYAAEIISSKEVMKLVLLNGEGKAFTDKDFEKWANDETVGLGALNKLAKKLYLFLVVQGGKVGQGY